VVTVVEWIERSSGLTIEFFFFYKRDLELPSSVYK
jgi:hypothetical protein